MQLLGFGDSIAPGIYKLHSAFDNAVNFTRGHTVITAVTAEPGAGSGPVNMVLDTIEPLKTTPGMAVTPDTFAFPMAMFRKTPELQYNSSLAMPGGGFKRITLRLPEIKKHYLKHAPPQSLAVLFDPARENNFSTAFETGLLARAKEHFAKADLTGFKGLGGGLTPSGDDFITGVLCGYGVAAACGMQNTARRADILKIALGGNALSNTFLQCAAQGKYFARFKTLIETAADEDATALEHAVTAAINFGNTSGADTLAGLICYFEGRFK